MRIRILIPLLILVLLVSNASASFDDGLSVIKPSVNITQRATPAVDDSDDTEEASQDNQPVVDEYTKSDWLAGGVETGFENMLIKAVDTANSAWRGSLVADKVDENKAVIDEYGNVRGGVFIGVTENVEPDKNPDIQKFVTGTEAEWFWLVLTYLFGYTFAARIKRQTNVLFDQALKDYDLSDSRFVCGFGLCLASYSAPRLVIIAVEVCSRISQVFMLQVMDYIQPSADNAFMYIFMGVGEAVIGIPFVIRQWIITAVYATCRFLIVAFAIGIFKPELIRAYEYFKKILAIQPICVGLASFCLICIKTTHTETIGLPYAIMFITIAYILKNFMFGGRLDNTVRAYWYTKVLKRGA